MTRSYSPKNGTDLPAENYPGWHHALDLAAVPGFFEYPSEPAARYHPDRHGLDGLSFAHV